MSEPADELETADAALATARRASLLLAVALRSSSIERMGAAARGLRLAIENAQHRVAALRLDRRVDRPHQWLKLIADRAEALLRVAPESIETTGRIELPPSPEIYAEGVDLVDLDLDELDLARLWAHGASFTRVSARRSDLEIAELSSAHFTHCTFEDCTLDAATLDRATLEDTDLSRADLSRTSWRRAVVTRCRMQRVEMVGARLDDAVFTDCDLRRANLAIAKATPFTTARGTRFVRCDLRDSRWSHRALVDVSFIDCKMFGAHGTPSLVNVLIERPDVSMMGDGSRIGTAGDVIDGWTDFVRRGRRERR